MIKSVNGRNVTLEELEGFADRHGEFRGNRRTEKVKVQEMGSEKNRKDKKMY